MAETAGYGGNVQATGFTAGMKQWSINWTVDPLETTDFVDVGNSTCLAGIKRWSATVTVNWDAANTVTLGSTATLTFTTTTGKGYGGDGILINISPGVDVAGMATATMMFQGTGALVPDYS